MNIRKKIFFVILFTAVVLISACSRSDNDPGREYMPDMKHPITYEANYYDYYSLIHWESRDIYHELALPRKPVEGTVPRGYVGIANAHSIKEKLWEKNAMQSYPMNGHVPFYYKNTREGRLKASREITENPIPITEEGLKEGSELYQIYCGICHGSGGAGDGYLVRDGGKYPAVPANLISDGFIDTTAGAYYYTIMHGKNVMGSYADKLSYKERWNVIHFIRSLQAKERGAKYSAKANTLNDIGVPYSTIKDSVKKVKSMMSARGLYAESETTMQDTSHISDEKMEK